MRVVIINGDLWFVGKDVATALGYADTVNALKTHVPDKFKTGWRITTPSRGAQEVVLINEAGLYKLVLRSNLPNAEIFSDWVCSEVLPNIRKTGSYSIKPVNPVQTVASLVEPVEEKACVYVLLLSSQTVKIGVTNNIVERARVIERACGFPVIGIHTSELLPKTDALKVEKLLHEKFVLSRLEGEFFNVPFKSARRELERVLAELNLFESCALPDVNLADKLFSYANEIQNPDAKDKILIHAANLLVGQNIF